MKSDSKGEKENPTVKHNRMNIKIDLENLARQSESKYEQSESKHDQLESKHEQLESKHDQLESQEREIACNLRKTKENFDVCVVSGKECVCCNMNKQDCDESIQGPIPMQFDGHDTCFCKYKTPDPNEVTAVAVEK